MDTPDDTAVVQIVCPECGGEMRFDCDGCSGTGLGMDHDNRDSCLSCDGTGLGDRCDRCDDDGMMEVDVVLTCTCPVCDEEVRADASQLAPSRPVTLSCGHTCEFKDWLEEART